MNIQKKRFIKILLLCCIYTMVVVVQQSSASDQVVKKLSREQIVQELKDFLNNLTEPDDFSGVVLLAKNGVVIFNEAYGIANRDFNVPNRKDTKFNLGSMNKMFTSVAIAQLVERGKLSFDDLLSKFLPDFPDANSARYGYGFMIDGPRIVGHGGEFIGISSQLDIFLDTGWTVIVLSNQTKGAELVKLEIRELILSN